MSGPRRHELDVVPAQFIAVLSGSKRHEWRWNDCDFRQGDEVLLREWFQSLTDDGEEVEDVYTGRTILADVTWVTSGPDLVVPKGYCVMTISPKEIRR